MNTSVACILARLQAGPVSMSLGAPRVPGRQLAGLY